MNSMDVRDRLCEVNSQIESLIGLVCTSCREETVGRRDMANALMLVRDKVEKIEREFDAVHWG